MSCLARHLEAFEPHIRYELAWVDNDSVGPPPPPPPSKHCARIRRTPARAHTDKVNQCYASSRGFTPVLLVQRRLKRQGCGVWRRLAGVEREERNKLARCHSRAIGSGSLETCLEGQGPGALEVYREFDFERVALYRVNYGATHGFNTLLFDLCRRSRYVMTMEDERVRGEGEK